MRLLPTLSALILSAGAAWSEPPRVVTDILPVQGLVAQVLGDLGSPAVIVSPGASPHGYALRPTDARALEQAELVVWMGPALAPWLAGSLDTLAPDAPRVVLMDLPGTTLFEARDWGHEEDGEHGHGGTDAHAWLDPENAKLWLGVLAETLAKADPEHAAEYRANADAGRAGIDAAAAEVQAAVRALGPAPVLVYHDAFQYLEHSFGLEVLGAISGEDGAETGPAQLEALRDAAEARGAHCVLIEPQFSTRRIDAVFGAGRFDVAVIDPLGTSDAGAPGQYAQMLRGVAAALADCL